MSFTCTVPSPLESFFVRLRPSPCTANGIRRCSTSSLVARTDQLRRRRRRPIGARSLRALFARIQMYPSGSSLRRTHRKLITRWPESRRALLENGEHDTAVARAELLCVCAKHHHAEPEYPCSVTTVRVRHLGV
jgi:hypothetical protein